MDSPALRDETRPPLPLGQHQQLAPGRIVEQRERVARCFQGGPVLYGAVDDGDDFYEAGIKLLCQRMNGFAHIFAL